MYIIYILKIYTTWQAGIFYTSNKICYTYHVWPRSKWYILHHRAWKYISMSYTHMLHISCMSVHGLYTLTFYYVSASRQMSALYTHMCYTYHQTSRLHLSTWNRRPAPASRGYAAHWQCNWVTDSRKSNLLRILHKKLRCRQINSQFGSGLIKRLLLAHLNPISMIPM